MRSLKSKDPKQNLPSEAPIRRQPTTGDLFRIFCMGFVMAIVLTFAGHARATGVYTEHMMKISALSRQIAGLESEIKELIDQKRHSHNPEEIKTIIDSIATKHKDLEEIAAKHNTEWLFIRFKIPAQDDVAKRDYERYRVKSIKEMETELGMDAKLDRIKQRALAVFPVPSRADDPRFAPKVSPLLRRPASAENKDPDDPANFEPVKIVK